jgi:hypothetical protein
MIRGFIGTRFCNLHRDATRLHLRQTSKRKLNETHLSCFLHPTLFPSSQRCSRHRYVATLSWPPFSTLHLERHLLYHSETRSYAAQVMYARSYHWHASSCKLSWACKHMGTQALIIGAPTTMTKRLERHAPSTERRQPLRHDALYIVYWT